MAPNLFHNLLLDSTFVASHKSVAYEVRWRP